MGTAGIDASRISIVIPALNEEATIDECIAAIRRLDGGERCEVVVVDGDARGTTLAAVADGAVVKMIADPGRSSQMNHGAAAASGAVLLFLHADTRLPDRALRDVLDVLRDPSVVGGAFAHRFDSPRRVYRFMSYLLSRWTRWTRLPFGDQALFLRRNYFEAVGGFAPIAVMEDYELVRRIKGRGDRLRLLPSAATTSCRRLEDEGIARRVFKNWIMCALFDAGVPARGLVRHYRPHGAGRERVESRTPVVLARPSDNP